ncbi:response regulator transcription factor [Ferrimonas senticii]|uniref:response regulator transcription factor n=1 Tax=Ferrimonas senticii TaxID=394566 RepID=UPI00040584D2|nr:response regulator [Ferrimonas senticii]
MMKLLIIEDDIAFASALARRMTRHGFECHCIHQADLALASARQWQPSHILLDLKLNHDSGLDLVTPLRSALPTVKLVLLTGFASIASAVEAMRRGADDYLSKPADTQALLKALTGQGHNNDALLLDTMSPERLEWEHLNQVLAANEGNVSATARQLNMHRRTLQRKLQKKPVASTA